MHRGMMKCAVAGILLAVIIMGLSPVQAAEKKVTLGNKNFTEQYLIGNMMKQLLEAHGFTVDLKSDLSSMALRAGVESGDIDICAEYTGTAWMIYLRRKYTPGTDNRTLYQLVKEAEKSNDLIWLDPIWNNNTYALASWPAFIKKYNLSTLSDLAALYRSKDGTVDTFVDFEFSTRPDGLRALEEFYNFTVRESHVKTGTPGASLLALKGHKTDVAMVFGTDASIAKYGWHVYADDRSFFPPYDLTPYVRAAVLNTYPEIKAILNALVATFPGGGQDVTPEIISECQGIWRTLNAEVDIERREPHDVARDYLIAHGLITP
jgi:osmoprotectant transport system substrate-binding protein